MIYHAENFDEADQPMTLNTMAAYSSPPSPKKKQPQIYKNYSLVEVTIQMMVEDSELPVLSPISLKENIKKMVPGKFVNYKLLDSFTFIPTHYVGYRLAQKISENDSSYYITKNDDNDETVFSKIPFKNIEGKDYCIRGEDLYSIRELDENYDNDMKCDAPTMRYDKEHIPKFF